MENNIFITVFISWTEQNIHDAIKQFEVHRLTTWNINLYRKTFVKVFIRPGNQTLFDFLPFGGKSEDLSDNSVTLLQDCAAELKPFAIIRPFSSFVLPTRSWPIWEPFMPELMSRNIPHVNLFMMQIWHFAQWLCHIIVCAVSVITNHLCLTVFYRATVDTRRFQILYLKEYFSV